VGVLSHVTLFRLQAVKTYQQNMGVSFQDRTAGLGASKLLVAAALSTAPAQPLVCDKCDNPATKEDGGRFEGSVCSTLAAALSGPPGKSPRKAPLSSRTPLCLDCAEDVCKAHHVAGCSELRQYPSCIYSMGKLCLYWSFSSCTSKGVLVLPLQLHCFLL
jgi:hypothetical protein